MELEELRKNKPGALTAKVAREISSYWKEPEYQVLYDHDPKSDNVGKIVSSFGNLPYDRNTQLSHVDIAIVAKDKVFALIEIEETTDKPKTILGDIFGVLLGDQISFGKERQLVLDEHTTLLIFVKSQTLHDERNKYLRGRISKLRSNLLTTNSVIGNIDIKNFREDEELSALVLSTLDQAFNGEL